ncbi:MAG: NERD domain-containing protein [Kiritimatiellae bacterium]|nr:NERD domain-containing protein [Kiritimatiellia bacterium]
MARVLTTESSLAERRDAVRSEARRLKRLVPLEAAAAVVCGVLAAVTVARGGRAAPWLAAAGAAVVLAVGHGWKSRQDVEEDRMLRIGRGGEHRVADRLAELDDRHAVFNDLSIRSGLRRAQVDHLVVGPHGVVVIETKNWGGTLSGRATDTTWRQDRPGRPSRRLDNPLRQNRQQVTVVRACLAGAQLGHVPVDPLVVFAAPDVRLNIESDRPLPLVRAEELPRWWSARLAAPPVIGPDDIERVIRRVQEAM